MTRYSFRYLPFLASGLGLSLAGPAWAADAQPPQTPPASAYEEVMRAQYAARQAPTPASAAEAGRVYDIYLRSIGKPTQDGAADNPNSGSDAGVSAR